MSHGVVRDMMYYKQEKEKDRLRIGGGSWSINLEEVDFTRIHTIVYCTEKAHYIISTGAAIAHGFRRTLGGEDKLVVPVKYWVVKETEDV